MKNIDLKKVDIEIKELKMSDKLLIVKPKTGQHVGSLVSLASLGRLELNVLNPKVLSGVSAGVILYRNIFLEFEFESETTYNLNTKKLVLTTKKVEFVIDEKKDYKMLHKHFDYPARKSYSVVSVAEFLEYEQSS